MKNVYIAGMGRSGTTLLQNILNTHSNIVAPPETFFVLHLKHKYQKITNWNEKIIQNFIDDLYTDRPFRLTWNIKKETILSKFKNTKINNFSEACNLVFCCYNPILAHKNIKLVCDKKPIYPLFINDLLAINANAKIIHMIRDSRGTIASQIHTFKRKDALALGYHWSNINDKLDHIEKIMPKQYYCLHYEDLILDTKKTLINLCDFLALPFDENMLNYSKKLKPVLQKKAPVLQKIHQHSFAPINKKLVDNWKTKLTIIQQNDVEFATYKTAKSFNYHFEKPKISFIRKNIIYSLSKAKVILNVSIIKLYFRMPLAIRKSILKIRSVLTDYKYKSNS